MVIAGFEPRDVLAAIRMLIRQLNDGRAEVENQFTRGVTRDGNLKAKAMVAEVFELRPRFEWRGLGTVEYSGLRINSRYAKYDAERRFALVCTPCNPIGSCMVSSEGACAAWYQYRNGLAARA